MSLCFEDVGPAGVGDVGGSYVSELPWTSGRVPLAGVGDGLDVILADIWARDAIGVRWGFEEREDKVTCRSCSYLTSERLS